MLKCKKLTAEFKIIGIADVHKIDFETDLMFKKAKYSYRTRTISMTAASSLLPLTLSILYSSIFELKDTFPISDSR